MPVVLSYEDVNALGSLAHEAGRGPAFAQRQQFDLGMMSQISAQRDATAAQLQSISAQERQREADRDFAREQAGAQRQFDYDRMLAAEEANRQGLERAMFDANIDSQSRIADQLLKSQLTGQRDKQLHLQQLERIEREAALRPQRGGTDRGGQITPGGFPDRDFAEQEVQQFGHLIPFGTGSAVSASAASRGRERGMETAKNLSALPTSELQAYVQSRPSDAWAPYIRSVIQARQTAAGGTAGVSGDSSGGVGALPEGSLPSGAGQPAGAAASLRGGRSFTGAVDPRFSSMSDAQLQQLAENPALLNRLMGGG